MFRLGAALVWLHNAWEFMLYSSVLRRLLLVRSQILVFSLSDCSL